MQPATLIAKYCLKHPDLNLEIHKDGQIARGDSVMSILSLELNTGSSVIVQIDQENPQAIQYITSILDGAVE